MKIKSLLLIYLFVLAVSTAIGQINAFNLPIEYEWEPEKDTSWYFDFKRANKNPNNVVKFRLKDISKIKQLKKYPNLRYLDLGGLKLKKLPAEVLKLTQLKGLNLEVNYLTNLPNELKNLKDLEDLVLSDNDFEIIPNVISELPKLKSLYVRTSRKLKYLYESFALICKITSLEELRFIEFGPNKFYNIPCEITNLKKLRFLHIDAIVIKEIPDCLGEMKSLEHLYFGTNNLGRVGSNNLELPPSICYLPNLTNLSFTDNGLKRLPKEFKDFKSLKNLGLEIDENFDTSSLKHLQNLNLISFYAQFGEVMPVEICNITNLKALFIFGYKQKYLPENIGNLKNLENFVMNADELIEIPESFCDLKKIISINFSFPNKLNKLPECFTKFENLEFLEIVSKNKIKVPPLKNIKCIKFELTDCSGYFHDEYFDWFLDYF